VTVTGELAPCVYLGLPVNVPFTRRYFNQSYQVNNYSYGNVREGGTEKLLQKPAYLNFIDYFRDNPLSFAPLQHVRDKGQPTVALNKEQRDPVFSRRWPPSCQGCFKSLGF
jgi:hypothetical protein